jgi:hypothetical protein
MSGIEALKKLQLGLETTPGTAVAATTIWRGPVSWKDARTLLRVEEDIGILLPKPRLVETSRFATLEMAATPLTFEQGPYAFAAGIENIVTGVADGAGSGKIYEYNLGVAAVQLLKSYTMEIGDNQRADKIEYAQVQKIVIKGAARGPLTMAISWIGRQCTDAEFTAALVPPTVVEALFGKTAVYLDAASGTIGTTPVVCSVLGVELTLNTGLVPIFSAGGDLFYCVTAQGAPNLTGKLILRHNAAGEAEIGFARAMAVRLLRLKSLGPALITPATWTNKTWQASMAIQYDEVPDLGAQDGLHTVELPFTVVDSGSIIPTFIFVNELTALI